MPFCEWKCKYDCIYIHFIHTHAINNNNNNNSNNSNNKDNNNRYDVYDCRIVSYETCVAIYYIIAHYNLLQMLHFTHWILLKHVIHDASAASRLSMSPASAGICGASWSFQGARGFRQKWGYPNSWMIYKGKSQSKMDDLWWFGGTPILGDHHSTSSPSLSPVLGICLFFCFIRRCFRHFPWWVGWVGCVGDLFTGRCHMAWDAWCCISGVFLLHFLRHWICMCAHVINHASEASTHTRGTSIITGMVALHWWKWVQYQCKAVQLQPCHTTCLWVSARE